MFLILYEYFENIDIIFVQGYHYRIPVEKIKTQKIKIVNFHQSLLPKYVGRHPLNWVIVNGEKWTGITFHFINEKFDEGDIILRKKIRILKNDNIIDLYNKTIKVGEELISEVFEKIFDENFVPIPQNKAEKTYYRPRIPEDGEILSSDTIEQVKNKIRALVFPYPGAFVIYNNKKIIVKEIKIIKLKNEIDKFIFEYKKSICLKLKDGIVKIKTTNYAD